MFESLPTVLVDLICRFAYDATLEETKSALHYILFMKGLCLHPLCMREYVSDFSTVRKPYIYSRIGRQSISFFAPWSATNCVPSPFYKFFVWFSRSELYDSTKMRIVVDDLDFRCIKNMFDEFPVQKQRNYKYSIMEYIDLDPENSAIHLSPIFREISLVNLCFHPSTLARFLISPHSASVIDWTKTSIIHI